MNCRNFYEVGDGYRASTLYPVGSTWKITVDCPGVIAGEILTVISVNDGTNGDADDTVIETDNGCYTATESYDILLYFEYPDSSVKQASALR